VAVCSTTPGALGEIPQNVCGAALHRNSAVKKATDDAYHDETERAGRLLIGLPTTRGRAVARPRLFLERL